MLWFILYSVVFYIFLRFIVKLSSLSIVYFHKGFHVNLMFFLSFHISYFFTKRSSRFLVAFLHHSFAQINNIAVLLFGF